MVYSWLLCHFSLCYILYVYASEIGADEQVRPSNRSYNIIRNILRGRRRELEEIPNNLFHLGAPNYTIEEPTIPKQGCSAVKQLAMSVHLWWTYLF